MARPSPTPSLSGECDATHIAALITAIIRALLEELRPMMHQAGRFLESLNLRLRAVLERVEEPFVATAFYLIADTDSISSATFKSESRPCS